MLGGIGSSLVDHHAIGVPRSARLGIALICALGLICAFSPSAAKAIPSGYILDFEFGSGGSEAGQFQGSFSNACCPGIGVGVDASTGDIYVGDSSNYRVQKFDENGNFLRMWGYGVLDGSNEFQVCTEPPCQAGQSGVAPGQFGQPMSVAVDNSSGPNAGDVYVADWVRNLILKYSSEGAYLGAIDGSESPGGAFQRLSGKGAVSIDNQGFIWVLDHFADEQESRILRFSNQPGTEYVGGSQFTTKYSANPLLDPEPYENHTMEAAASGQEVFGTSYEDLIRYSANGAAFRVAVTEIGGRFGSSEPEVAVNSSNEHFVLSIEGSLFEFNEDFEKVSAPFSCGCSIGSMAIDPISGDLYVGAGFGGEKVVVFKPRRVPLTVTEPASDVLRTTATLHGTTEPDPVEGGEVTECKFEWGYTTTYEFEAPCEPAPPYDDLTQVKADLSGIETDVPTHFRLAATNAVDTNFGKDVEFTTHAVIDATTEPPTDVTAASATLNGSFDADGIPTQYYFEWGKDKNNLQNVTPVTDADPTPGLQAVSEPISGIEDYTVYFYRLRATNSFGTSFGAIMSFRTTIPTLPVVGNSKSSNVTDTAAHLSAQVTPNFGETFYGFEYGETAAYGDQVLGSDLLPADDQPHAVETGIDGLTPGRTYHYRPIAINFGGITYGPDQTFTTLDIPKVISSSSANVGTTGAHLSALVHPSLSATSVRFEYGPSLAYGSSTGSIPIGAGSSVVPVGVAVSGLSPGTGYHFRVVAVNLIGPALGPDQSFTTVALAPPPPPKQGCKRGFVKRNGKCVCRRGSVKRRGRCVKRQRVKRRRANRHRKAAQRKQGKTTRGTRRNGR